MLCKEFYFCILGCPTIPFEGNLYWVETNQLTSLQVDCLVSMGCEIFHWMNFEHSVILSGCFTLL